MTEVTARRKRDEHGFWRVGWIAIVNGEEIGGIKFRSKAEALAYGKRVAEYQTGTKHAERNRE
jgi:hypothetical protein